MCRSGHESNGTQPRRCTVSQAQAAAHNATRTMTRAAAQLRTATTETRREQLRDRFMVACHELRDLAGMQEGEYPPIPDTVSRVTWYAERLNDMPYEALSDESEKAAAEGDFPSVELLCIEMERRAEFGSAHPDELADDEAHRWRAWRDDPEVIERLAGLDPITHPEARMMTPANARDREAMLRADYEAWIEMQILDAEDDCRGHLMNTAGENAATRKALSGGGSRSQAIRSLWSNHVLASNYASDELRDWWEKHPRHSFESWCVMMEGKPQGHGDTKSTLNERRRKKVA